ncbi:MAG: bile acid:sodium symporter family protein [Steroidobacteraceae bacterium]|jgi:BASS family bile acid:Na+ symporter
MQLQQAVLSLVLMTMVFAVALDLRTSDFARVFAMPRRIAIGLLPQFVWLPVATWLVTRTLDLPAATEAAMLLVACCPGGSLSNVVTHWGRGDTAYSVSLSAVATVLAFVLTPFNFAWTMSANPATHSFMQALSLSPLDIASSLLFLLGLPLIAGLWLRHRRAELADRWREPLGRFGLIALLLFIAIGLIRERHLLNAAIVLPLALVIAHNALGLGLGWITGKLFSLDVPQRRAITIEAGMQNSGLALGIIALQFDSDLGMVIIASLWGIWHIVSGMSLAFLWRQLDARPGI